MFVTYSIVVEDSIVILTGCCPTSVQVTLKYIVSGVFSGATVFINQCQVLLVHPNALKRHIYSQLCPVTWPIKNIHRQGCPIDWSNFCYQQSNNTDTILDITSKVTHFYWHCFRNKCSKTICRLLQCQISC